MKRSLIALALVTGCGASDQAANNAAAAGDLGPPAIDTQVAAEPAPGGAGPIGASLTGLYESGAGKQVNQLCVLEKAGTAQFGLVVWGGNLHSCSGAGRIERSGDKLSLTMAGDSACTVQATIRGGTVTLASAVPAGCSYYCGARARLDGATFTRRGSTSADARKAKDLAGDPLCG
jgi:hypothetical protein